MDPISLSPALLALLLGTLAVATITDLRGRVIPNWLTGPSALGGLGLAAATGRAPAALLGGLLAAAPFLLANLARPEGMGMGDVKLAALLGLDLGLLVWPALAVGLALAGLSGTMISLGRRLDPTETALPLAPFLALGTGLVVLGRSGMLQ